MNNADHLLEAEIVLGAESREQAEAERKNVRAERLAATVTEFIEWRAFSYWFRLCVETDGSVSDSLTAVLRARCPGFLEYAAAFARTHPGEEEFLWLRFLDWADETLFQGPSAEGWRHALGYDATRDPRMDQLRAYWKECRQAWKSRPPTSLPSFENWRATGFQIRVP